MTQAQQNVIYYPRVDNIIQHTISPTIESGTTEFQLHSRLFVVSVYNLVQAGNISPTFAEMILALSHEKPNQV
jgi:hypothetical protein